MDKKRRELLKYTAALGMGIAISPLLIEESKKIKRFGIQLYSVRDVLPADPRNILKQLASFGYKQIESYEKDNDLFWGMGHIGFRKYMDDLGMTIISSHCDIKKDFKRKVDEAAAIGMKYLICPSKKGDAKSLDSFKQFAEEFNICGQQCKDVGIRFAYHNHDYSLKLMNGEFPQDILMKETDPNLVDFEMDLYWLVTAGQDPVQWLKKYPNRFRLCHVKDRSKNPGASNDKNMVELGTGAIEFPKVLKEASKNGMQYYFAEQDFSPGGNSLKSAEANAAYLKMLKL